MLQRKIQFLENYSIPEDFSEDGSAGRPPASNVGLGVMVISLSDPLPEVAYYPSPSILVFEAGAADNVLRDGCPGDTDGCPNISHDWGRV